MRREIGELPWPKLILALVKFEKTMIEMRKYTMIEGDNIIGSESE
jgi:hypothetical protein